jgi:hypothetical protein
MPFKFTGTLNRIEFKLSPEDLANTQRASLQWLRTDLALAVQ